MVCAQLTVGARRFVVTLASAAAATVFAFGVTIALAAAPTARAQPQPGSGDPFFIEHMTSVFTPPASEARHGRSSRWRTKSAMPEPKGKVIFRPLT